MAHSITLRVFPPVSYTLSDNQRTVECGDIEPVLLCTKPFCAMSVCNKACSAICKLSFITLQMAEHASLQTHIAHKGLAEQAPYHLILQSFGNHSRYSSPAGIPGELCYEPFKTLVGNTLFLLWAKHNPPILKLGEHAISIISILFGYHLRYGSLMGKPR